jgi:hypothetical protein
MKKQSAAIASLIMMAGTIAFAQWYDEIQTDSDWESAFREGFYDYNTYQIYREIVESGDITDTSDFIISAFGNPPGEIIKYPHYTERLNVKSPANEKRGYLPDRLRFGRKVHDGDNVGYISVSRDRGIISGRLKIRDENGIWKADRRTIVYDKGKFQVTLGNYSVKAGCGLGIGRFDYRPVSYEKTISSHRDILFPDNSYYNGLKIAHGNLTLLYSIKRYADVRKSSAGGYWVTDIGGFSAGVTGSGTILSSDAGELVMGAGSLFFEDKARKFQAEIGYAESGGGLCLRARGADYDIRAWHYDDSFVNLQSSGFAQPDYESYSDERYELSFRQAQKGETGLFLKRHIYISGAKITGISEVWKKSPAHDIAVENYIYLNREFSSGLMIDTRYNDRRGRGSDKTVLSAKAALRREYRIEISGSLRVDDGKTDKERSRYSLFVAVPVESRLELSGRIRRDFLGAFDCFLEQKSILIEGLSLKTSYRWKEEYDSDLGPFYVTMEKLW